MSLAAPEPPARLFAWPPRMHLCDRCRMHYDQDELELVEVGEPELWCSGCRFEPSGYAS